MLAAFFAEILQPHQLMARPAAAPTLESMVPRQFGTWTLVPEISPVKPTDPEGYVPDSLSTKIYGQEIGRAYTDGHGDTVMLLVAYGPAQNYRLKSHRPEICYTANGFRVSEKTEALLRSFHIFELPAPFQTIVCRIELYVFGNPLLRLR